MAKERIDLRDKLRAHKFEFDLLQEIPCSKEENKKYQELLNVSFQAATRKHFLYLMP